MPKSASALDHWKSLSPDQRIIETWIGRLCDGLSIYEISENKDLTKFIVRLGYLSDFELHNPTLMSNLFRDIEAAL